MKTLSIATTDQIKGNPKVIGRLMALFSKSHDTITRWIVSRDIRLTLPAAIAIIREETGFSDEEILETETVA